MPAVGVHSSLASNLGHVLPISADRFSALSSDFALLLFIHGREATRPACSIRFHRKNLLLVLVVSHPAILKQRYVSYVLRLLHL